MKKLSEHFNTISVKKGELFALELPDNGASTGYTWDVSVSAGKATRVKQEYYDPTPPRTPEEEMMCGKTIVNRTTFRADEAGEVQLKAELRRPWEKGTPAAQTKTFKVTVS